MSTASTIPTHDLAALNECCGNTNVVVNMLNCPTGLATKDTSTRGKNPIQINTLTKRRQFNVQRIAGDIGKTTPLHMDSGW